jgi:hypothetical protein
LTASSKLTKLEFLELQQQWYERLKLFGFNDIESNHNGRFYLKSHISIQSLDEERKQYFESIRSKISDETTSYRSNLDKIVMQNHAEGSKIKDICQELSRNGLNRDRRAVRIIIRRYEMAWGIRYYTRKELDRRTRK